MVIDTELPRAGEVGSVGAMREPARVGDSGGPVLGRRLATVLAVTFLLAVHYALAVHSLLQESPTVDEVVHMPAGVTYWQKGTFRLYHHNPPLVKLVAALPVVLAKPVTQGLYEMRSWRAREPSQSNFAYTFAIANVGQYFELFRPPG